MSDLLDKYRDHYDALYLGMTRPGLANGMHATLGQMFPRAGGGYNLYRGANSPDQIDWDDPVGAAGRDAENVRNFADRPHDTNKVYHYAVRAISPGGVEQDRDGDPAGLRFDVSGQALLPPVHPPDELQCDPVAGGKFRLRWHYHATRRDQAPSGFRIYGDGGTGTVDYDAVVTTVPFEFWRRHYEYVTASFAQGTDVLWAVRTVNSAGQEERNTGAVLGKADQDDPPANEGVSLG